MNSVVKSVCELAVVIGLGVLTCACAATATRNEMNIGGRKVSYVMQKCKPSIKWDGVTVVLEGLNIPNKGDLAFSVGKVDFSEKALKEVRDTVFFYDGLLNATCQTLVRISDEKLIMDYSLHRDKLLQALASTLSKVESAPNSAVVETVVSASKAEGEKLGSTPRK